MSLNLEISSYFFKYFFSSTYLSFGDSNYTYTRLLKFVSELLKPLSFYKKYLFSLCISFWVASIALLSSSLIFPFVLSNLLLSPSSVSVSFKTLQILAFVVVFYICFYVFSISMSYWEGGLLDYSYKNYINVYICYYNNSYVCSG